MEPVKMVDETEPETVNYGKDERLVLSAFAQDSRRALSPTEAALIVGENTDLSKAFKQLESRGVIYHNPGDKMYQDEKRYRIK